MVDKKYEHLTMKEKTEAIKKTLNLFDLTDEGARKRGIFFLSTMKTFNLVLAHNKYEIFTFFDPNGFCSSLALAKEITFYLTTYIRDRDFLEEVSDRSFQTVGDFELVARILAELYKLFIGRLEYKEANEQSKEFLNTYIIDSIFLMFEIVHRPKFAEGVNQVLLKSLLLYSQKIFQLICSLVGSFDFLLKHILERVLATSLNEAVYLKVLSFCLRACYPTEGRKKFLDIVRNTMIEIKVKELKPLQNELHIHYGSEPLLNMILSLKETYRISNCLEYIIYRGISIRDQERKLALIEVLDALSKFGEFPILLCVTRYIAGRIQNEERILSESGRATRELSNTLELMANLTQNPFYKSMFLSEEIMRYLNPVLKHLLASKFKESEFPVLQVYQNLLDIKVSLNNTKEEMKKSKDADGLVDRISKDHLSDMVRHLADHLTLEGVSDSDSDEEQNKLKVQASILKTLQKFFDANYYDSLCLKELSKGEDSRICIFIKSVISTMNSSKFAGLVAGCSKEFEDIATSLFQIMVSLVYPTWLTRDTYRTKRIKSIGVLIGNDKDIDRSKEVGNALLSSAAKVFGEFSSAYIGMKCLFDVYIDTVYKKEEILQSLYKSSPVYKEEDLVKKKSFYETPFERNYRLEWDNDKKIPEVTKDIIEALSNLNEPKQLKYAEFEQFGPNPELEFTFETTPITSFDLSASKPSSTGSKFVDVNFFHPITQARPVYIGYPAKKIEPRGAFKANHSASIPTIVAQKKPSGALPHFARKTTQPPSSDHQNGSLGSQSHSMYPGVEGSIASHINSESGISHSPAKPTEHIAPARSITDPRYPPQQEYYTSASTHPNSQHLQPPNHQASHPSYSPHGYYQSPAAYHPQPQTSQNPDIMEAFNRNLYRFQSQGHPQDLYQPANSAHHAASPYPAHQMYHQSYYDQHYAQMYAHQMQYGAIPGVAGSHIPGVYPQHASQIPQDPSHRTSAYYNPVSPAQNHPQGEDQRR